MTILEFNKICNANQRRVFLELQLYGDTEESIKRQSDVSYGYMAALTLLAEYQLIKVDEPYDGIRDFHIVKD